MNIIAINGSPRKNKNTATVLQHALDGALAASNGIAQVELVHLYSLRFSPCLSCFECKKIGGKSYGKCAVNDALTPLLERLSQADGIILGSPIYFAGLTGNMVSFMERLFFPFFTYTPDYASIAPKRMQTAMVYTMNVTTEAMEQYNYPQRLRGHESFVERCFTKPRLLYVNNTYQFDDYSKYLATCFSEPAKRAHKEQQFPVDCQRAREMGADMVRAIQADK